MELMQNQFSLTLQDGTVVVSSDAKSRLLNAAGKVADSVFVNDDINNVDLSSNFIRQARAAALATDTLEGGGKVYGDFASLLNTLAGDVKLRDSGLQTVDHASARQRFDSTSISIPADSDVAAIVNDMGPGGTPSATYDSALDQSVAIMNESAPVLSNSRQMHIEWSYPGSTANLSGFKIYIVVNDDNVNKQTCIVSNANASSTDCTVDAAPGDSVNVYMTATMNSDQESAMSVDYTNTIPIVQFRADKTSGSCPLLTSFDSSETNDPVSGASRTYSWDLGDGNIDTATDHPTHKFNSSNSYNVMLTVTDTVEGIFSASNQAELRIDCL